MNRTGFYLATHCDGRIAESVDRKRCCRNSRDNGIILNRKYISGSDLMNSKKWMNWVCRIVELDNSLLRLKFSHLQDECSMNKVITKIKNFLLLFRYINVISNTIEYLLINIEKFNRLIILLKEFPVKLAFLPGKSSLFVDK